MDEKRKKTTVKGIRLHREIDADILAWLSTQDNVSRAIREAVRAYIKSLHTQEQVWTKVCRIENLLQDIIESGVTVSGNGHHEEQAHDDEEPDLAAALDELITKRS